LAQGEAGPGRGAKSLGTSLAALRTNIHETLKHKKLYNTARHDKKFRRAHTFNWTGISSAILSGAEVFRTYCAHRVEEDTLLEANRFEGGHHR